MALAIVNREIVLESMRIAGANSTAKEIADVAMKNFPESLQRQIDINDGDEIKATAYVYYCYNRLRGKRLNNLNADISVEISEEGEYRYTLNDIAEIESDLESDLEADEIDMQSAVETVNRRQIEKNAYAKLSAVDKMRLDDFWVVAKRLNTICGYTCFNVDHAKSIKELGEAAHHPSNLQIIGAEQNKSKNYKSMERITWEKQVQYIKNAVSNALFGEQSKDQELEYCLSQLKIIF